MRALAHDRARRRMERKVGARGLRMILEDLMLDLMYHLPSQRKVREFVVTKEMVKNHEINFSFALSLRRQVNGPPICFQAVKRTRPDCLPMMPIRDVVIFPHMMTPFVVGRESSVRALEEALAGDKRIFLATQHDAAVDEPKPNEIYQVGTIANIVQSLKLPDGNIKVLVEGVERGKILKLSNEEGYFRVNVQTTAVPAGHHAEPRTAGPARHLAL